MSKPGSQRIQAVRVGGSAGMTTGSATWDETLLLMTFPNNASSKQSIHLATRAKVLVRFVQIHAVDLGGADLLMAKAGNTSKDDLNDTQ
jgi:hypothetical protein